MRFIDKLKLKLRVFFYNKALSGKKNRNTVLLVDNLWERNAVPIDNITLFNFIKNNSNYGFDAVYITKKENEKSDELMNEYGDSIIFVKAKSIRYYWKLYKALRRAKYLCDSFQSFDPLLYKMIKNSDNVVSVFTQHGINFFKDEFITPDSYGQNVFNKVMVSNELERNIFINKGGYTEDDIWKNGLFRWDNVTGETCNDEKIVFMYFTFRAYLRDMSKEEFDNCVYIKFLKEIFHSKELRNLMDENNIKLKIAVHHIINEFFKNEIDENLVFISEDEIGKVKQIASVLVTDYSSMCFELMRQNKPVIFFKIADSEECKKYGHSNDMADPYNNKEQYLYRIVDNMDSFIEEIKILVENDFKISDDERNIYDVFYYYRNNYCKRFMELLGDADNNN